MNNHNGTRCVCPIHNTYFLKQNRANDRELHGVWHVFPYHPLFIRTVRKSTFSEMYYKQFSLDSKIIFTTRFAIIYREFIHLH